MKMTKDIKKVVDALRDSDKHHLCFISDGDNISVAMSCTAEDLLIFLASLVDKQPWVMEVLEDFVDGMVDYDNDEEDSEDSNVFNNSNPTYLN